MIAILMTLFGVIMFLAGYLAGSYITVMLQKEPLLYQSNDTVTTTPPKTGMFRTPIAIVAGGESLSISGDDVGPVQRPTATQLTEWGKSEKQKESEDAMRDSFANDPELVKTKEMVSKFRESTGQV